MKLILVNNSDKIEYNVSNNQGKILGYIKIIEKDKLFTDLPDRILMDTLNDFFNKISKKNIKYLKYKGDSAYIKYNFFYHPIKKMNFIYLDKYKYSIKSEFIAQEFVDKIFNERGNWEKDDESKDLELLVKEGITYTKDKSLWDVESIIGNNVNPNSTLVNNKGKHRKLIPEALHKFLPDQINITLTPDFKPINYEKYFEIYPVLILKPVDGWGGHGITVHDNYKSFEKRINQLKELKKNDGWSDKKAKKYDFSNYLNWVLDEYIINPLLYDNRKFHVRVYFIYHQYFNIKKAYIYEKIRLAVAEDPYKNSDYNNKKIHDTHYVVKDIMELVYLDEILPKSKYSYVLEQIKMLFTAIGENMNTKCYEENLICYQIYAADVMIDNDYNIKLLEINNQPGFNLMLNTSGMILENIMYHIIDKIFPPKNHVDEPETKFITLININKLNNNDNTSLGRVNDPLTFIDVVAAAWFEEGYGPPPKRDRTGGYYLKCSDDEETFHIHIVGAGGRDHPNSWSRKGEERRKWEYLNWLMTPKEQAFYIYFKSGYYKESLCARYRKLNQK